MSLVLTPLSSVEPRPQTWLWLERIPSRHITLLEGDPGVGKTCMIADIAARVTTGRPMPGCEDAGPPGNVFWFSGEEPLEQVRTNLWAAGADLDQVLAVSSVSANGDHRLVLPRAADDIADAITESKATPVVFDPFTAFLPANPASDVAVRSVCVPLARIAEQHRAAIVLVRH